MVELRNVVGYEDRYGVTRNGEVYSYRKKRWMKIQYSPKHEQARLVLTDEFGKHLVLINRIVAEAYIPNPNNLPWALHKKLATPQINKVSNLYWGTHLQASINRVKQGRSGFGLHKNK